MQCVKFSKKLQSEQFLLRNHWKLGFLKYCIKVRLLSLWKEKEEVVWLPLPSIDQLVTWLHVTWFSCNIGFNNRTAEQSKELQPPDRQYPRQEGPKHFVMWHKCYITNLCFSQGWQVGNSCHWGRWKRAWKAGGMHWREEEEEGWRC